ncbi:MAG: glutaminyl-peptide cyclotransferase [Deltaproteobacteria bacterium]|nr:glutaminyl-peptide cyclotransferase [Deltaproteobacteria bacterium]
MNRLLPRSLTLVGLFLLLGGILLIAATVFSAEIGRPSSSEATTPTVTNSTQPTISYPVPVVGYRIVNTYPHDPRAFTQGLVFADDALYEGTGLRGPSSLRKVDLKTGNILQVRQLPARFFGEGITIYGNRVIQLTWRARVGFVYDRQTFQLLHTFNYPTEGWGITHDGRSLIMSDGTSTLYLLDPQTFQEVGRLEVHTRDGPVSRLNELEYVQGEIYANVWKTDRIARISPQTGEVLGWIDLEGLLKPEDRYRRIDVLNGIAYDVKNDRLFVSGKLWPKLFEIELVVLEK